MHNLKVGKNEEILFDGKIISRKELTPEFLNNIMICSLKKDIEFEIDENSNVGYLFKRIQEETEENTEFYKKWKENKAKYEASKSELERLISSDEKKDNSGN